MRENAALSSSQGQPATASAPAAPAPAKPAAKGAVGPQVKRVNAASKKQPKQRIAVEEKKKPAPEKKEAKVINLAGRRDPFVSPVVNRSMLGSGCSTGKKCLTIEQIDLRGVVKSDEGMIAVVVNALDKAYFLRENDPVFNGYVVKITQDSIVFKQTLQDKLGKPITREVTKRINTPAV